MKSNFIPKIYHLAINGNVNCYNSFKSNFNFGSYFTFDEFNNKIEYCYVFGAVHSAFGSTLGVFVKITDLDMFIRNFTQNDISFDKIIDKIINDNYLPIVNVHHKV